MESQSSLKNFPFFFLLYPVRLFTCLLVILRALPVTVYLWPTIFFSLVFNAIIQLCLRHVYPVLFHYIGGMQYKQGKRFVKQCQKMEAD